MIRRRLSPRLLLRRPHPAIFNLPSELCPLAGAFALAAFLAAAPLAAQVITIDTSGKGPVAANGPIDRQYSQIAPTHVDLPKAPLDPKTRLMLIRELQSEQGFAMRPFPRGHKGLTLEANGKLAPAGDPYLNMVIAEGLSAKPGGRLVITDIKIDRDRIVFDLNDGPDAKHRFLQHVHIGMGPDTGDPDIDPSLANQQGGPAGARLTLTFHGSVPELTSQQVKALLAPLISFDVKTPIQAFTDTLPDELKKAILGHKVLVGMSIEMVLYAKGHPLTKSREMEGQMPFEEWIYGAPPQEVDFVRINGNRVIRVEVAKDGEPVQVFTKDVVSAMLRADGTPVMTAQSNVRIVHEGDVATDPDRQTPAALPSLRNPGEELPAQSSGAGEMRPVQMPKPHKDDDQLGSNPDEQQPSPASSQTSQPAPANGQQSQPPASSGNPQSPPANPPPPASSAQHLVTSRAAPLRNPVAVQSN